MDTVVPLREADKVGGSGVLSGLHDGLGVTIADLIHLMIVLGSAAAETPPARETFNSEPWT